MLMVSCCWSIVLSWAIVVGQLCHYSIGWLPATTTGTSRHSLAMGLSRRKYLFFDLLSSRRASVAAGVSFTRLSAILPEGYQEFGEHVIRKAGAECGIVKDDDLTIEWKADRIVVTVRGQVFVSAVEAEEGDEDFMLMMEDDGEDDDEEDEEDDDYDSVDGDEGEDEELLLDGAMMDDSEETDKSTTTTSTSSPRGVDVAALARAINSALDDGGIGLMIAEAHEIEVTTPGVSDELEGQIMFEAYKGFDVICQQRDVKTNKIKQVEGRLVERNDEFTILNIKGRMKKMENDTVLSVKLPKAKKEKGVK